MGGSGGQAWAICCRVGGGGWQNCKGFWRRHIAQGLARAAGIGAVEIPDVFLVGADPARAGLGQGLDQGGEVQIGPHCVKLGQGLDQRRGIARGAVQCDGCGGLLAPRLLIQNLGDASAQDRFGPDLQEDPCPIGGHGADHAGEIDRADQMGAHRGALACGVRVMGARCGVGIDRQGGRLPLGGGKGLVELAARGLHQGRVEGLAHRHRGDLQTGGFDLGHGGGNRIAGACDHALARAVEIGDDHAFDPGQCGCGGLGITGDGGHGAGTGGIGILDHRAPARFGQADQIGQIKGARGMQGDELAIGMARHHIGAQPQPAQQAQKPGLKDAKGGLGHFGGGQRGHLGLFGGRREGIGRPDQPRQGAGRDLGGAAKGRSPETWGLGQDRLGRLQRAQQAGLQKCALAQHAGILRALSGEHEGQLGPCGQGGAEVQMNPLGGGLSRHKGGFGGGKPGLRLLQRRGGQRQTGAQMRAFAGHPRSLQRQIAQ